jgi:tetratricopeptide (TPR) repeat protein
MLDQRIANYRGLFQVGLIGIILCFVALLGRFMIASFWTNLANHDFLQVRLTRGQPGVYPFSLLGRENHAIDAWEKADSYYAMAVAIAPDFCEARWGLLRSLLMHSDLDAARKVALPCAERLAFNPLSQIDLLAALAAAGPDQSLIHYYENHFIPGSLLPDTTRDIIALSYLPKLDRALAARDRLAIDLYIDRILQLRPEDLYVNYQAFRVNRRFNYIEASVYLDKLTNFQNNGVNPEDGRLLEYVARVLPELITQNIWTTNQARYVVDYLIYNRTAEVGTEKVIKNLAITFTDEPAWVAYLGDLYAQRKLWSDASKAYLGLISKHPSWAYAYLRLGQIQENACAEMPILQAGCLDKAYGWYDRYHQLNPSDLLGLKKLSDLCALFVCADHNWSTELMTRLAASEPAFTINPDRNRLSEGWTLLGYSVDEDRMTHCEATEIWLYWTVPASAKIISKPDWYYDGARWIQVIERAKSLVQNGAFELGMQKFLPEGQNVLYHGCMLPECLMPFGFSKDPYHAPIDYHTVQLMERYGNVTHVAVANTELRFPSAGFASQDYPVKPVSLYVQSVWLKSENGKAYFGAAYSSELVTVAQREPYNYAAIGATSTEWVHYAGLIQVPSEVTSVSLWLLNDNAPNSQVAFDNVFLVPIGSPTTASP